MSTEQQEREKRERAEHAKRLNQGLQTPVKGTVKTAADLPTHDDQRRTGDRWIAKDTGHGWFWSGVEWINVGLLQSDTAQWRLEAFVGAA